MPTSASSTSASSASARSLSAVCMQHATELVNTTFGVWFGHNRIAQAVRVTWAHPGGVSSRAVPPIPPPAAMDAAAGDIGGGGARKESPCWTMVSRSWTRESKFRRRSL